VVFTFGNHPNAVLSPNQIPLPVIGDEQRLSLLEDAGVDVVISVDFDSEFASMPPETFFTDYLVGNLGAKFVIIGEGFRFGAGGAGSIETLRNLGETHGVQVIEVPSVLIDGVIASTTNVRKALDSGGVKLAARLLGRNHETTGIVEHGLKIGRTIGFPTANMSREAEGYLPIDGVYAGWLHSEGERYPAALSVGINETFQAVPRLIEAHVLDRNDLDFYDKIVTLEYVDFIRPVAKFDGVESLVAQINLDIDEVRAKLLL
jgi:riboflavin kinase/FMN adenylyltransferase